MAVVKIAKNTATGVHVVINMLSTTLVATSSYCCQLLMAPTRQDVDEAHARRLWLSVGTFNIKNWTLLPRRRKVLWALMFGTSIVIQLIYNSAVYLSSIANDYSVVTVPLEFTNATHPDSHFPTEDCFESMKSGDDLPLYWSGSGHPADTVGIGNDWRGDTGPYAWMWDDLPNYCHNYDWSIGQGCTEQEALNITAVSQDRLPVDISHWPQNSCSNNTHWPPGGFDTLRATPLVESCLVERTPEHCRVFVNIPICLIVIACNMVKVVCMFITTHEDRSDVFNTIGDAISSFLKRPDPTTANECMLSRDMRRHPDRPVYIWKSVHLRPQPARPIPRLPPPIRPTQPPKQPRHWASATKLSLWLTAGYLTPLCLIPIGILWVMMDSNGISLSTVGPGLINSSTTLTGLSNSFVGMVLLVNTVQLLITGLYFLYNDMLTRMLLSVEYNDFAVKRKPLRVSFPKGEQRSTFYLTIPYRYSVPMLLAFTVVHWLVSEGLFFVQVLPYNVHGKSVPSRVLNTCGYSVMSLLIAELIVIMAAIIITGLSFRKFKAPMMPLAFNCSAAISAACHPPPDDQDAAYHPVMWGEVQMDRADTVETSSCPHCSFSSKAVVPPEVDCVYV